MARHEEDCDRCGTSGELLLAVTPWGDPAATKKCPDCDGRGFLPLSSREASPWH